MDTEKLRELKALLDAGVLTEDEFVDAKRIVMSEGAPASAPASTSKSTLTGPQWTFAEQLAVKQAAHWFAVGSAGACIVACFMPFMYGDTLVRLVAEGRFLLAVLPLAALFAGVWTLTHKVRSAMHAFWAVSFALPVVYFIEPMDYSYSSQSFFDVVGGGWIAMLLGSWCGILVLMGPLGGWSAITPNFARALESRRTARWESMMQDED